MKKYVVIEIPADLIDRRDLQSDAKIPWKGLIDPYSLKRPKKRR